MQHEALSPFLSPHGTASGELSRFNRNFPSTLGEVVVTDPRDPFVYINAHTSKAHEAPSERAKQLLWTVYRINGNLPDSDDDAKWHDLMIKTDRLFENLTQKDVAWTEKYIKHLAHLDFEDAMRTADNSQMDQSNDPRI